MTTFTVEQDWHDRGGTERPKIEDVTFNILQNVPNGTASTYISDKGELLNSHVNDKLYYYTINATNFNGSDYEYKVYRETEKKDSSTYLYYYTVPEYAENEKAYVYSSQPTYQFNSEEYKDEPTNESNKYLAVGLTEFEFTMNWIDAYDSSARPTINAQYIKDHFDLYNKNTNTIVNFLPDDVNAEDYITITDDGNTTSVKIKRLEDIHFNQATNEYYANEYYLKLKDNITNTPLTLPVETPTLASTNDYYAMKSENQWIHANETDVTYQNGEINLLLTGQTDFSGTVVWEDNETKTTRENDTSAATFSLWRYSVTNHNDDADYSAKYGDPLTLNGKTNTVSFNNLDKYDIKGQLYTYYALENVTVEKDGSLLPYQITYENTDPNQSDNKKLLNGGTVTNKLSDQIEITVSADWIAKS